MSRTSESSSTMTTSDSDYSNNLYDPSIFSTSKRSNQNLIHLPSCESTSYIEETLGKERDTILSSFNIGNNPEKVDVKNLD